MQLYLITHAQTQQLPAVAPDAWSLSPLGIEQAEKLASAPFWDGINRIVVSAEPKTWLTVAAVALHRQLPVLIDSRLDELRRSGWTEDYAAHVMKVFGAPEKSIDGWESAASVQTRAMAAVRDLERRHAGESIAVVGHGLCLSIVCAAILGEAAVNFAAWQRLLFTSYCCLSLRPPSVLIDFELSDAPVR